MRASLIGIGIVICIVPVATGAKNHCIIAPIINKATKTNDTVYSIDR